MPLIDLAEQDEGHQSLISCKGQVRNISKDKVHNMIVQYRATCFMTDNQEFAKLPTSS